MASRTSFVDYTWPLACEWYGDYLQCLIPYFFVSYRFIHEEPNGGMITVYKYFITCNVMTKLVNRKNKCQELFLSECVVQLGR
jgi:hypothetical protein